jgi:hypothetical protein
MDIEALLNPPEESQMMDGTTDEEICQAVLAARKDEEGESGDVGVEDVDDVSVEPIPTYAKVLQAASIINRYIGHVGDPAMCKFEADLASFARKMQLERSSMLRTTHITDYFHKY